MGCQTSTGCTLGGSALGSVKVGNAQCGRSAADELLVGGVSTKACVDQYVQDQLIIFMAMAKGRSRIRCTFPLTLHTQTGIFVVELMTKAKFTVIEDEAISNDAGGDGGKTCVIHCEGIGLLNNKRL